MSHVKSSLQFAPPKIENFRLPETVEQYKELSYTERLHLRDKYPRIYEKFSKESARLPGDWRLE